jgi:hypothetical protein
MIVRIQCPDENLYKNKDLTRSLDKVFALPEMQIAWKGSFSKSLTTSGHPLLSPTHLPGAGTLVEWIISEMSKPRPVKIIGSWANRILPGWTGHGQSHNHLGQHHVDLVGIFYVNVPKTGAELICLDEDKNENRIQPAIGELVIHDAYMFHRVGNHMEDIVRTALVFDTVYID